MQLKIRIRSREQLEYTIVGEYESIVQAEEAMLVEIQKGGFLRCPGILLNLANVLFVTIEEIKEEEVKTEETT